ncbi:hypothetical protein AB0B89_13810 [Sphaerisporangium sp. NPDC049002]|uniref:hypothetical protein n=1 Tax=unclassified Sphaerisporangium TaxID=2630420 RepID=UPI0033E04C9F
MNPLKTLLRVIAGAILVAPLVAVPSASAAASTAAAPYVRITVNSITSWRTQHSGTDMTFLKISGPSLMPLMEVTYEVWPGNGASYPMTPGKCLVFLPAECPGGIPYVYPVYEHDIVTKPVFTPNGGRVTLNLRKRNPWIADDDLLLESFPLGPLTNSVTYSFRPHAYTQGADYQIDVTLSPSMTPY